MHLDISFIFYETHTSKILYILYVRKTNGHVLHINFSCYLTNFLRNESILIWILIQIIKIILYIILSVLLCKEKQAVHQFLNSRNQKIKLKFSADIKLNQNEHLQ